MKQHWEEQKASREARRKAHREQIAAEWGEAFIAQPNVRAELRRHAWRMGRLYVIQQIAEKEGKPAVVQRAKALMDKERAHHRRRMEALKAQGSGPAASASGSAPSIAPPARSGAAAQQPAGGKP